MDLLLISYPERNTMKHILTIVFSMALVLATVGCNRTSDPPTTASQQAVEMEQKARKLSMQAEALEADATRLRKELDANEAAVKTMKKAIQDLPGSPPTVATREKRTGTNTPDPTQKRGSQ